MNLPRKTVFWVLTFVAFAGGFHLIDEKAEDVKRAEEAKLRLFPFEPQDVKEFWISDNGGSMVKVVMEGEEWRLTKPKTAKADKDIVEKTLRNIVKARKDAVLFVDPEPSKLEELGLDVADLEVGLITESGGTAIRFGDKGPTHNV
ncbi:MAG: DUF4340 domain-containing protein, partial [Desulfobacterales bacterium]|nr:DUF4340 domain-containing protein [Desulfobacterales bacterium]